jgi:predicted transcriptional regulator
MVMENGRPVGTVNRMKIIKSIAEMEYHVKIKELMKTNLEFLDGNADAGNFIKKLAAREERLYPVVDNGHFLGVTNFQYVMEYLLIHPDSTKEYGRIKSLAGLV